MSRFERSTEEHASASPPAPPGLAARAAALVREYPECFWYWREDASIHSLEDVRLVIRQLRAYGDRDAWLAARDLSECLSPRSRRTSVLAVLAANRSEESHFAGGVLLHAPDDSPRFSRDFDIFHDVTAEVARASEQDVASLRAAGFPVEPISRTGEWDRETTFRRAVVRGTAGGVVEIDWAADSAFRFFPVERDVQLGWRLHLFDAATNKALTLAARTETRDYVDIVELSRTCPLAAICWAACGKDPGFTPLSLLRMMRRFARIDPVELDKIRARAIDPVALKAAWVALGDEAETRMTAVADERPDIPIGVAFVDPAGVPGWIGDDPGLRIHPPSVRGCWPVVRGLDLE